MSEVKVTITINPCCDRVKYLSDILNQARNLNLNETYCLEIETLILNLMTLSNNNDYDGLITFYDNSIDDILALRDSAFNTWVDSVKDRFTPVEKTPIPPPLEP